MSSLCLRPGRLALPDLRRVWSERLELLLDPAARPAVDAAAAVVAKVIAEGRTVYGVNTGFGLLARTMHLELAAAPPEEPVASPAIEVRPELIHSACDTLYTSGTMGRYSKMLNAVKEAPGELYRGGRA